MKNITLNEEKIYKYKSKKGIKDEYFTSAIRTHTCIFCEDLDKVLDILSSGYTIKVEWTKVTDAESGVNCAMEGADVSLTIGKDEIGFDDLKVLDKVYEFSSLSYHIVELMTTISLLVNVEKYEDKEKRINYYSLKKQK